MEDIDILQMEPNKWNPPTRNKSWNIFKLLCHSTPMCQKYITAKGSEIIDCLNHAVAAWQVCDFSFGSGSLVEGTDITAADYGTSTPNYVSDNDTMNMLYCVHVIDEGDVLPQRFYNYMYCRAERGEHTTDGFRKVRIIHSPEYHCIRQNEAERVVHIINQSIEHGYISSSKLLATAIRQPDYGSPMEETDRTGRCIQGPSQIIGSDGSPSDFVRCFYLRTWPKEAESWLTRQTHWPDKQLKNKIRKMGYLLVATGNRKSQESDLEWRCSFSIAEKILFQSMTKCQRYTFIILKVLLKEHLPSHINSDDEKQLLSTYHFKTLFLWGLEDSNVKWETRLTYIGSKMQDNIGHMLDKLMRWIKQQYFPHYFIPSVNLLDSTQLQGREDSLIGIISAIKDDLYEKIMQFLSGLEIGMLQPNLLIFSNKDDRRLRFMSYHHQIMPYFMGRVQRRMHLEVADSTLILRRIQLTHSRLIEGIMHMKMDLDPQLQHLYTSMYTDPKRDKLLTEVVPGLIDQYRGCIYLAKYYMAARDGRVLPDLLHKAESLLKDTLHLDPCSGYVKLACLYIITKNFTQAIDILQTAENNFLYSHKNMLISGLRNFELNEVEIESYSTEGYIFACHEFFQKWIEGQAISDIIFQWPEFTTAPDLVQFELIHESSMPHNIIDLFYNYGEDHEPTTIVATNCRLQFPPLSMIKLLKFVCALNSGCFSASHMENLVADLIASSLSLTVVEGVNDMYKVFNMAAWCYMKLKNYKLALRMMTAAIVSSKTTHSCCFSYLFLAYFI